MQEQIKAEFFGPDDVPPPPLTWDDAVQNAHYELMDIMERARSTADTG